MALTFCRISFSCLGAAVWEKGCVINYLGKDRVEKADKSYQGEEYLVRGEGEGDEECDVGKGCNDKSRQEHLREMRKRGRLISDCE
jgi:hypothetical protein